MAVRRRPRVEGPPAELLMFRGDDWITDDPVPPRELWHKARFEWAKAHPDDLSLGGDVLDMLRERVAYRAGAVVNLPGVSTLRCSAPLKISPDDSAIWG